LTYNKLFKNGNFLWFTGLSGAGETALANRLLTSLIVKGTKVKILGGDEIREQIYTVVDF